MACLTHMPFDERRTPLERSMEAFQETVRKSGPAAMGSYSLIGAIILLAIVNLVRRGSVR